VGSPQQWTLAAGSSQCSSNLRRIPCLYSPLTTANLHLTPCSSPPDAFLHSPGSVFACAEHDPSRALSDSPAGSVASSNLSRATAAGGGRGGSSVERQLYKAIKTLAEQVG